MDSEDDFYKDSSDTDDAEPDYGFVEEDDDDSAIVASTNQKRYVVLREEDIHSRQKDDIERVSTVLFISKVEASVLLCHYHWSVTKVSEEWLADEGGVRRTVGLLERPIIPPSDAEELTCWICFESYPPEKLSSVSCGHLFCTKCWSGYISTSINDGSGCLMLRCPYSSCPAAVDQDTIERFASDEDREKSNRYFLRSYVEDNRKMKWCPAAGCSYAVYFATSSGSYDVSCLCLYNFCWNCTAEAHSPVDCATAAEWLLKSSSGSENLNWMLAYSKPCPMCKRPIEKIGGSSKMTCVPPCRFQFCWLCLDPWSDHGERTGGLYACNQYFTAKKEGLYEETERRREMVKASLERYVHYHERWASNQLSREKATADLKFPRTMHLEMLSDIQCKPKSELEFIIETWLQLIECRRVLKWTYVYGYYLPEHDHSKRHFFEHLQGEAKSGLERLRHCTEKELDQYLYADNSSIDSNSFDQRNEKLL